MVEAKKKKEVKDEAESSDGEELLARKAKVKKEVVAKEVKVKTTKVEVTKDAKEPRKTKVKVEEQEEVFKWWEQKEQHPEGQHWRTLEHNGVLFPPEYVPHKRPVFYKMDDGTFKEVAMDPDEEEVATMFAVMREQVRPPSDYYVNPVFRKNFFTDWLEILNSNPERNLRRFGTRQHLIKVLERVNFDPIWEWHLEQKEIKKNMTKEQKAQIKKERDELEKNNKYCLWDGKKQPVGNFRIEPPGLFRGRGKHPLMGKLKRRVQPEDIIINIGKEAKVPEPPPGRNWKEVRHDNTVTWLANWVDNVCGNGKYVMLAASSMVKGKSDYKKFEKARNLGEIVNVIRENYRKAWRSSDISIQQRAVALYFIDKLALRCGHEKGEDEAETFGACSLKCEHINLEKENHVLFDFLGKDSIRYYNEVQVEPEVYRLLRAFVKGKTPDSDLFDKLRSEQLNSHLKELMPGLTAKVFRTYNASFTLDREFHEFPTSKNASLPEKVAEFNAANTKVAILCNHQRSVTKGHQKTMTQYSDKLAQVKSLLERLLAVKELVQKDKKHGWDKAREQWDVDEHAQQMAWLEKYGTQEEKDLYQEKIANKTTGPKKSPASPKTAKVKDEAKKKSTKVKDEASDSDSGSEVPLTKKKKSPKKTSKKKDSDSDSDSPPAKKKKKVKATSDSDSEVPLVKKKKSKAAKSKADSDSDSDVPLVKKKSKSSKSKADSDDSSDAPVAKAKKSKAKATKQKASERKKFESSDDDDDSLPPQKKKRTN